MPPANSPTDTPALLPSIELLPDSLTTSPILQSFETLSNPVPNFAATLLTHAASDTRESAMSDPPLSRSTRSARPPYLTEDEFRDFTSESRRRVQQNLETSNDGRAPTAQSYSNRIPEQQSLYDWAAYNAENDSEDSVDGTEPYVYRRSEDAAAERRELLSSLNESRRWRSQLRRDLEPRDESGRVALPSIQHLRRSVQDLPDNTTNTEERPPAPRSPSVTAALTRLIERQRLERRERRETPAAASYRDGETVTDEERARLRLHLADLRRRERVADPESVTDEERARVRRHLLDARRRERIAERLDKHRRQRPSMPKTVKMLKYLSRLRECRTSLDSHNLIDDLKICDSYTNWETMPADIIVSTSDLVPPQPSSFLTPGTKFTGIQRAPHELPAGLLNRDRDYLRRMVANRNLNLSSTDLPGVLTSESAENSSYVIVAGVNLGGSIGMGVTQEATSSAASEARRLQILDHLREERRRHEEAMGALSAPYLKEQPPDSWPVSVNLHTLSLRPGDMTISGTMSASHIPDKFPSASPDHKPEGSSMESYFEGEIIDFNVHTLETNENVDGPRHFPHCAIEVDARYWSGIGPFRVVAERVRRERKMVVEGEGSKDLAADADEETVEKEVDAEIARCLSDQLWIKNKVGGEGEWLLMRWKEQCFVSPPPPSSIPLSASTSEFHLHGSGARSTTVAMTTGCVGLTILGFYYIALHRASGRIEGLYFDPGSQPFQELRLGVEGVWKEDHGQDTLGEDVVGLKRWFPSVEFR